MSAINWIPNDVTISQDVLECAVVKVAQEHYNNYGLVLKWIIEHGGVYERDGPWDIVICDGIHLFIRDRKLAMLAKLTWG